MGPKTHFNKRTEKAEKVKSSRGARNRKDWNCKEYSCPVNKTCDRELNPERLQRNVNISPIRETRHYGSSLHRKSHVVYSSVIMNNLSDKEKGD